MSKFEKQVRNKQNAHHLVTNNDQKIAQEELQQPRKVGKSTSSAIMEKLQIKQETTG